MNPVTGNVDRKEP